MALRRMTELDAQFMALETTTQHSHYCAVAIYETAQGDQPLDAARMRRLLAERMHLLGPLRWKVVPVPFGLDHPRFAESVVDLDDHVDEITLAAGADERNLAEVVADTLSIPLDRSLPLWKLTVIRGLPDDRVAVAFVLHHATADGISARDILNTILDTTPSGRVVDEPLPGEAEPEDIPGRVVLFLQGLLGALVQPSRAMKVAPRVLPHLDQVPTLRTLHGVELISRAARRVQHLLSRSSEPLVLERPASAPVTPFNVPLSANRSVAFGTLPLTTVKAVKNELGVTVNDVVVALCAGALRRWLSVQDDLAPEPLVAFMPLSVRGSELFGNGFSSLISPIPTHLGEARERVTYAHQELSTLKKRHKTVPDTLLRDANTLIPPILFPLASRIVLGASAKQQVRPPVNLLISNIPGSPERLYCAGAHLVAHFPLSLVFDGMGLNITVVSYEDQLDLGIVADKEAVPDAWELMDHIHAELKELSTLLGQA